MNKDIRYKLPTYYVWRNGAGKQIGLEFTESGSNLLLEPINSKNHLANCAINIPFDSLDEVIGVLTNINNQFKR